MRPPEAVLHQNARTNTWLRHLAIVTAGLLLALNVVTALSVLRIALGARDQARHNARMLSIVLEVTGCTPADKPGDCARRLGARTVAEGARRVAEVDCVTRRALAGIPAPDPARLCADQTPPRIYPG